MFHDFDIARPNLGLRILTPAPETEVQVPRLSHRVAAKARPKLGREKNPQLFWANLGPLSKVKLLVRVLGDYQRFAKFFTRFSFHSFHFFLLPFQTPRDTKGDLICMSLVQHAQCLPNVCSHWRSFKFKNISA